MKSFNKQDFIDFAISKGALAFGEFTLKSGRSSPYFFNTGVFNNGADLYTLGSYYASAMHSFDIQCDQIFGPAYKGIPLACAVAMASAREFNHSVSFCCNRKEEKTHGDGGLFIGAKPAGKIMIVDDVITAGISIRESVNMLRQAGAMPVAAMVALDRREPGTSHEAASRDIMDMGIKFASMVTLHDILEFLATRSKFSAEFEAMQAHMKTVASVEYRM